jgi:hypothetical protein
MVIGSCQELSECATFDVTSDKLTLTETAKELRYASSTIGPLRNGPPWRWKSKLPLIKTLSHNVEAAQWVTQHAKGCG